jgi:hypothetical protein
MALNNYGRALGQLAKESVKGSVKGFAMGIKGAAMNEMPGLTAMYGLSRQVKDRANKLSEASAIDASVKEQRTNNVISIEMVRQLRSINNNVLQQTRISALQANNAKQTAMFAEESEREKTQRDKELLDAIKSLNLSTAPLWYLEFYKASKPDIYKNLTPEQLQIDWNLFYLEHFT